MSSHQEQYMSIMRGVEVLDLCGTTVPSQLLVTGDQAFPLAMTSGGAALMAASAYGRGRMVALGHESYLGSLPALVQNALGWLLGDGADSPAVVGVHRTAQDVVDNLSSSSFRPHVVESLGEALEAGVPLYVTDAHCVGAPEDAGALVQFVKAGGGLLIAGHAWSWKQQNPEDDVLRNYPGNQVTGVAGIYFSEQQAKVAECLQVDPQIPVSWKNIAVDKDFEEDLGFLLEGVEDQDFAGPWTSEALVHGPLAFPVGTTEKGKAFLAAGYHGRGRLVVATHKQYLGRKRLAVFLHNALRWLDGGRNGTVGVDPAVEFLLSEQSELTCEKTAFRKDLSVFVCNMESDVHTEEIQNFVAEGGGLLIGGNALDWANTHPEETISQFPGNRLLTRMGISLKGNKLKGDCYKAPQPSGEQSYHFRNLLRRFICHVTQGAELTKQEMAYLNKLGKDFRPDFIQMIKDYYCSFTQVLSALKDVLKKRKEGENLVPQIKIVREKKKQEEPIVKTRKDLLLLHLGEQVYRACQEPDDLVPYLIKDFPDLRVVSNHKVPLDVNTKNTSEETWISTGLYLSPGMKTTITLPSQIVNKGWQVQIGCQTDSLKRRLKEKEGLKRALRVHQCFPVTTETMQVCNLWGGLIYLVAPPATHLQGAELSVIKAVLAPYYKSGVTTKSEWELLRDAEGKAPAPWAELEFENIILTVPSVYVRGLDGDDLLGLEKLWDDIMGHVAELAAIDRTFPRKERIVADVQISCGSMHDGYPIMMTWGSVHTVVDKAEDLKIPGRMWGPLHELGHNQQRDCWEFRPHTGEATCNLWSVYVSEKVCITPEEGKLTPLQAHRALTKEKRREMVEAYIDGGRSLDDWTVWTALFTYLQLAEEEQFGWSAFKKVFAKYHTMGDTKWSRDPKENKAKMNLYVRTFSQAVGRDLCHFFKAGWGWPVDDATEKALSSLPAWTDHPMA